MKKYFFNEDGTIKVVNMIILIAIVIGLVVLFIFTKFLKPMYDVNYEPYTTTTKTSKIVMCDNCSMKFTVSELNLKTSSEYSLSDYLEVEKIPLNSLKFLDYDNKLLTIANKEGKLFLKTNNIIGKTKLTASYDKIKISIEVNIEASEITSVNFLEHPYYIYQGKLNELSLLTDPVGLTASDFSITTQDSSIVEIENGKLLGKSIGETNITLEFNQEIKTQKVIVLEDLIHVTLENEKEEIYEIKKDEIKDNTLNIIVTLEDSLNKGYSQDVLEITHEDNGIIPIIAYDGKNIGTDLSYRYRISLSTLEGSTTIKFKLSDNSYRYLKIGE